MEARKNNVIVNVDKVLSPEQTKLLEHLTDLLGTLVEETDDMIWVVAAEGMVRLGMAVKLAKELRGGLNE